MTTRKKTSKKKVPRVSRALARAADVWTPAAVPDSSISIRIPLPPDVVMALQEHVETGAKLLAMFSRVAEVPPGELAATIKGAVDALTRDQKRLVAAYRARKKR